MKYFRKLERYIEDTPWDEWLIKNDKYLERFCIWVAIIAGAYFGIFIIIGLTNQG
jgi:hypothetical protein